MRYEGYGIHNSSKNVKISKLQESKTTTKIEHKKLITTRKNMEGLNSLITYLEHITILNVFNVKILRQSSTGIFGSRETIFGWHQDNKGKKKLEKLPIIILLLDTKPSIQILTETPIEYKKQGSSTLFHELDYTERKL